MLLEYDDSINQQITDFESIFFAIAPAAEADKYISNSQELANMELEITLLNKTLGNIFKNRKSLERTITRITTKMKSFQNKTLELEESNTENWYLVFIS